MKIPRTVERPALHVGQITKADIILIGAILSLGLLTLLAATYARPKGSVVEISVGGRVYMKHDLTRDGIIDIQGALGTTVIQVANRQARILSSPCRDKICVHMGAIDAGGGVLICVPNEVTARIVSDENDALDALTR